MMDHNTFGFNKDQLLQVYAFNLMYAKNLVEDVTDEQLYRSPGAGLENHPGFTLGHLVIASAMTAECVDQNCDMPEGWEEFFRRTGPGDPRLPVTDVVGLPSKAELIKELESKHELVEIGIRQADVGRFAEPMEWRFDTYFPTLGGLLTFMCTTHEAMHLAQVAAWRRAYGLESSLGRL